VKGASPRLVSHFFANLSDKLIPPAQKMHLKYLIHC
jgi:hypothetical protein